MLQFISKIGFNVKEMVQDESVNNIANWVVVSSKIPIVNHQHIKTLYQDARILKDHNLQTDLRTL